MIFFGKGLIGQGLIEAEVSKLIFFILGKLENLENIGRNDQDKESYE